MCCIIATVASIYLLFDEILCSHYSLGRRLFLTTYNYGKLYILISYTCMIGRFEYIILLNLLIILSGNSF